VVLIIRGTVWKFGDNINTDVMSPGYVRPPAQTKDYCMVAIKPEFPKQVKKGDIVVGGQNFGCGSSRESAPRNLKELGVGCVIANSMGRIFYRNCIAIGLPAIVGEGMSESFNDGDVAEVNVTEGKIKNITTGLETEFPKMPKTMLEILNAGGIISLLVKKEK